MKYRNKRNEGNIEIRIKEIKEKYENNKKKKYIIVIDSVQPHFA